MDDPLEQEAERVSAQILNMPAKHHEGRSLAQLTSTRPTAPAPLPRTEFPHAVRETLESPGFPLEASTRGLMESRFHHDFGNVRVHADPRSARSAAGVQANAYTVGAHIAFAAGRYQPGAPESDRLIAHELTHVVQQGASTPLRSAPKAQTSTPQVLQRSSHRLARDTAPPNLQSSETLDNYTDPTGNKFELGDAAGPRLLMGMDREGRDVTCHVFNFEAGTAEDMPLAQWASWTRMLGVTSDLSAMGHQFSPKELRDLWPNPVPAMMRRYESGLSTLDDSTVLSTYRGMVRSDARSTLDSNERQLDDLLNAPNKVAKIQEYSNGLKEASLIRDALETRKADIAHSLVTQHSFTFGLPHAGTGPDTYQNLRLHQEMGEVDNTLKTWYSAFPMLTRMKTDDITADAVEAKLQAIKGNIISTRADLASGSLDPMKMDNVRSRVAGQLGTKATAVVAAEDKSNSRWAIAGAVGLLALTIALLFVPGGAFIDAAIGVALAAKSIDDAITLGHAANTSMHVDDGLVSQAAANDAAFQAVLSTVFAVIGAAAAGFKVLRVARALSTVGKSMPELSIAERAAVARSIANDAKLVSTFGKVATDDTAIAGRVSAAVKRSAGNASALRSSLAEIAEIASIPRRPPTADAYEPLRQITDGSDVQQVSKVTGFSPAEVQGAKQNLMLDEHVLVDDNGALYRGRFTAIESDAKLWARVAKGEQLVEGDRRALAELIRHEAVEGGILSQQQATLESLFVQGKLEDKLRSFLQSKGVNGIDTLLAGEPKPITPYRYAHLVAHFTSGPNPGTPLAGRLPLPNVVP